MESTKSRIQRIYLLKIIDLTDLSLKHLINIYIYVVTNHEYAFCKTSQNRQMCLLS